MMVTMLFVVLGIALLLTVPIAVSLALTSAIVILTFYPGSPMMKILAQAMVTTSDSFPLMAIPFFMLVGIIMEKTGIAMKLVRVGEAIAGSVPGGLGAAAVLACMFFAAISGSGPASVAAIGTIMIPAMVARGYERDYSGSLLAAASTVGPVIPPSIPMIVYGATIGVSVIELFTAGIVPGILMGAGLLVYNYTISKKRGYVGVARKGGLKWVLAQLWDGKWALLMPVIVLGGIYGGVFSPTEAAVIGVLYALLVGWLQKELTYKKLAEGLIEAACLSSIFEIVSINIPEINKPQLIINKIKRGLSVIPRINWANIWGICSIVNNRPNVVAPPSTIITIDDRQAASINPSVSFLYVSSLCP